VETANEIMLRLAEEQHGVVSRRQLIELGVSGALVDQRVEARRLVAVFAGVYGVGHGILSHRGWWSAALLSGGPGSVLSHTSAAACWGLIRPRHRVEIIRGFNREPVGSVNGPRRTPNRSLLVVHRTRVLPGRDLTDHGGFPLTTVPRTILNLAASFNLERLSSVVADAERMGLVDWNELAAISHRGPGWKGIGKLREIVREWDPAAGATRSELERRFLGFCRAHDVPPPSVNTRVEGLEVDCAWLEKRLIVELDGFRFHSDRRSFESDRRRDTILANAGYEVRRVTHAQLKDDPQFVLTEVLGRLMTSRHDRPREDRPGNDF